MKKSPNRILKESIAQDIYEETVGKYPQRFNGPVVTAPEVEDRRKGKPITFTAMVPAVYDIAVSVYGKTFILVKWQGGSTRRGSEVLKSKEKATTFIIEMFVNNNPQKAFKEIE